MNLELDPRLGRSRVRAWAAGPLVVDRRSRTLESLRGRGLATELQRHGTDSVMARASLEAACFDGPDAPHLPQARLPRARVRVASRSSRVRKAPDSRTRHRTCRRHSRAPPCADDGPCASVLLARYRRWCRGSVATVEPDAKGPPSIGRSRRAARTLQVYFHLSPRKFNGSSTSAAKKPGIFRLLTIATHRRGRWRWRSARTRVETKPLAGRYRNFLCTTLMDFVLAEPTTPAARALVGHVGREFLESNAEVLCSSSGSDETLTRMAATGGLRACGPGK